jgi:hypothetical protein
MFLLDFKPEEQEVLKASEYSKSFWLREMVLCCNPFMETEGAAVGKTVNTHAFFAHPSMKLHIFVTKE